MHKTNHCFLIGNLGADPIEKGRSDKFGPIVRFSVAENVQTFDRESKTFKVVHTNWFNVATFGSTAERVKKGLKKGDRVAIQGHLKTSRYTDKSGNERSGFEIVADDVAVWKPLPSASGHASAETQEGAIPSEDESLPF